MSSRRAQHEPCVAVCVFIHPTVKTCFRRTTESYLRRGKNDCKCSTTLTELETRIVYLFNGHNKDGDHSCIYPINRYRDGRYRMTTKRWWECFHVICWRHLYLLQPETYLLSMNGYGDGKGSEWFHLYMSYGRFRVHVWSALALVQAHPTMSYIRVVLLYYTILYYTILYYTTYTSR